MKKFLRGLLVVLILVGACVYFIPNDVINSLSVKLSGHSEDSSIDADGYRFYYESLNDTEKSAYRSIYAALSDSDFPQRIVIPKLENGEMSKVFEALSYDNPELFYLGNSCRMVNIGNLYFFVPDYLLSKDTYNGYMAQVKTAADSILGGLNNTMSDYEKELYIHDYLVKNCEYSDAEGNLNYTVYGTLINKTANCEGYARTAKYLLNRAGVKCRVITGNAKNESGKVEGHMWNIITLNDQKYHLDVTWDDYAIADDKLDSSRSPSHMFFNITTDEISMTHSDIRLMGDVCGLSDDNYYVKSGLLFSVYNDSVKNKIAEATASAVRSDGNSIEIRFDNMSAYSLAVNKLFTGEEVYRLITRANLITGKKLVENTVNYTLIDDKRVIRIFFNYI